MKKSIVLFGSMLGVLVALGVAATFYQEKFVGDGSGLFNIPGSALQSSSLNSNRFDADTLALLGGGGGGGPQLWGTNAMDGSITNVNGGGIIINANGYMTANRYYGDGANLNLLRSPIYDSTGIGTIISDDNNGTQTILTSPGQETGINL